jgi:hypothetical protein
VPVWISAPKKTRRTDKKATGADEKSRLYEASSWHSRETPPNSETCPTENPNKEMQTPCLNESFCLHERACKSYHLEQPDTPSHSPLFLYPFEINTLTQN